MSKKKLCVVCRKREVEPSISTYLCPKCENEEYDVRADIAAAEALEKEMY
jgi:Zn finger protein HypA/HybF involved in hydrogenase expression